MEDTRGKGVVAVVVTAGQRYSSSKQQASTRKRVQIGISGKKTRVKVCQCERVIYQIQEERER